MKNLKNSFWLWISVALLLAGLVILYVVFQHGKSSKRITESAPNPDQSNDTDEADEDEIILKHYNIISTGLKSDGLEDENLARYVTAQSMHETGVFTSDVYEKNNNLFGMTQPMQRDTTSIGKKGNYASYDSLEDSVRDYVLYYKYVGYPEAFGNVDEFVKALKAKTYFTDNYITYSQAVKKHLAHLNSLLNKG